MMRRRTAISDRHSRGGLGLIVALLATAAWANQPPEIRNIWINAIPSAGDQTVTVTADVYDPEGQPLTHQWTTSDGTLAGTADLDAIVTWTLPSGDGHRMISLQVSDAGGASTIAEFLAPIGPIHSYWSLSNSLLQPARIAVDAAGDLWVTDWARARAVHLSADGRPLGEFATGPRPLGIAVAPDGTILVGEDGLDRVARYTTAGALVGTIGAGALGMPNAIAVESVSGQICVADSEATQVAIYASDGTPQTPLGSAIGFPVDIAINSTTSEIFVAAQATSQILVYDFAGTLLRAFGSFGDSSGQFIRLQGIAIDASNRVLALDAHQDHVQLLEPTGQHVATFGHLGNWTSASRTPLGVASIPGERIFVTSSGTSLINVFAHWTWSVNNPPWSAEGVSIH